MTAEVSRETIERFVLLLAPFAPHLAEELWERLGHSESLACKSWPHYEDALLEESVVKVVVQVNGKKRALVEVAASISEDDLKTAIVSRMQDTEYAVSPEDRFITVFQSGSTVPRLVNVLHK